MLADGWTSCNYPPSTGIDQISFPGAAGIVGPSDPQQKRVPLALETEDVTVARIGERHGRDEAPYALIVSLTEPVDLDGLPTV